MKYRIPYLPISNKAFLKPKFNYQCYPTFNMKPFTDHKCREIIQEISSNTKFVYSKMVPEFGLHLITPEMEIWHKPVDESSHQNIDIFKRNPEPYWAVFWPGGQVLCRYILDYPAVLKGKRVVDFGAGSGALCIASILAGCEQVIANDIDATSLSATLLNVEKNLIDSAKLQLSKINFLEGSIIENARELALISDVLLIGDMYFDEQIGDKISHLVSNFISCGYGSKSNHKAVLIGDPGRWYLRDKNKRDLCRLRCIAKYELSDEIKTHNFGLTHGLIYEPIL